MEKKLIVFDLDGTLTESKAPMKKDMARLLRGLLAVKKVAVIGGGSYDQFKNQLVGHLDSPPELLKNLFLFRRPQRHFISIKRDGKKYTRKALPASEKKKIIKALNAMLRTVGYEHPKKVWGKVIEDRGTQLTFSALGQDIVDRLGAKKGVALKEEWNKKNNHLRLKIVKLLGGELKKFEVRSGGLTSIDITKKGIDKAYGVRQIKKTLNIPIKDMLFVGDALYPGGNDYAAKKTGIQCVAVKGPEDTKRIIEKIIK